MLTPTGWGSCAWEMIAEMMFPFSLVVSRCDMVRLLFGLSMLANQRTKRNGIGLEAVVMPERDWLRASAVAGQECSEARCGQLRPGVGLGFRSPARHAAFTFTGVVS